MDLPQSLTREEEIRILCDRLRELSVSFVVLNDPPREQIPVKAAPTQPPSTVRRRYYIIWSWGWYPEMEGIYYCSWSSLGAKVLGGALDQSGASLTACDNEREARQIYNDHWPGAFVEIKYP